ncbi:MAG: crotonyl-CoA carboxylase/reductase [Deltaproteobacteria bacterium]|nr:crotonyl-CoA carboxylase/reductase [Deltaproteobacteria bacterium]
MSKELYEVGEAPPIGTVPAKMNAWLIRPERFGEPLKGFAKEVVDVPSIADDEVLVYVMAAGVNYNNVWAALGIPVNVIGARNKAGEPEPFHIGGSDASGVVYKIGKDVKNVKVGDEVVIHCGTWDRNCPWVKAGNDPMYSPTFKIWGYETNWGSFAQFTKVQAHQCAPKPRHLSWEQAGAYMLVAATAYRMLHNWGDNAVKKDDVALIWGGAGGLGSMAIQIARAAGAIPIAVVSAADKVEFCKSLGAKGVINRNDFDHWGMLPHWKDNAGYATWLSGVRKFGKAIWDILGDKRGVNIVFEHPGETTVPTSIFVAETGGMVVICAGTTGYNATVDLRYLWMRQKRLQGSHFANDDQAYSVNDLVIQGKVDPCLSRTFTWDQLAECHQLMYENKHPHGNMAILVGASELGKGATSEVPLGDHHRTTRKAPAPVIDLYNVDDLAGFAIPEDPTPVAEVFHPSLPTVPVDGTLADVAHKMVDETVHAVVITEDDGTIAGVVSQTDLVLARQQGKPEEVALLGVRDFMTPNPLTITKTDTVQHAITMMTTRRIHRLIVVEEKDGKAIPVGVCAMTDIIRHMFKLGKRPL